MKKNFLSKTLKSGAETLKLGFGAWLYVAKLTIPALILTRLLLYFELIPYVAIAFKPLMSLVGLPPEAALIWVSSMLANLFVGVAVYLSLIPVMEPLTVVQITVLGSMIGIAHNLIAEGQICKGVGLSFGRVSVFRIVAAIIFGLGIHLFSLASGWGAEPAVMLKALEGISEPVPSWAGWALSCLKQLLFILLVIETMMLLMAAIKFFKLTKLIMIVLRPPLKLMGIGESASMVTIIGLVLGLSYSGGIIIAETRAGRILPKDIFGAMMLIAIFHSVIEDSLVIWTMGASLWWLLGARLIYCFALIALVMRLAEKPRWRPILVGEKLSGGFSGPAGQEI